MPNPLAGSKFYNRLGNLVTQPLWSLRPAPTGFGIITTIGRRSGKPRRQSIRAIRQGDVVYVVAIMGERAAWLKNIRANPHISVRLGGATLSGTLREIRDPSQRQEAMDLYVNTVVPADYLDYAAYHWGWPTHSKIIRAHRRWFEEGIPVAMHLDPS